MKIQFSKTLRISLLAAIVCTSIATAPQLQAYSQATRSSSQSISIAQTQTVRNTVIAVDSIGMTVADMDRSVDFYTKVLSFQKVSDVEVLGSEYEQLQGLFGVTIAGSQAETRQ